VGGGNSAIDSARVAVRNGAKEVHIFYRRDKADMPALPEEIEAAEQEGVILHCLTNPVRILGDQKVNRISLVRMEPGEFDRSGRKTAKPAPDSEYELDVDTVIMAIGQRPSDSFTQECELPISKDGRIIADQRTLSTGLPGLFAGGDAVTGPKTVIDAIAHGQRAASSIRRYLEGKTLGPRIERNGYRAVPVPQIQATEEELKEKARVTPPEIALKERKTSFKEVTLALTAEQARSEASRCMRCDLDIGD
jgi:NADPH-dependent glutamate synthase beta subunit-like oxidoreductase